MEVKQKTNKQKESSHHPREGRWEHGSLKKGTETTRCPEGTQVEKKKNLSKRRGNR